MKFTKITSIFVEGITDVALYRGILRRRFSFTGLRNEEEEKLTEELAIELGETKIIPLEQARFLKREGHLVIIQGKQGIIQLKEFCLEVKEAEVPIGRKIDECGIDIKSFFIFDDTIPSNCQKKIPPFVVVTSQSTPEEIILKIVDRLFNKQGGGEEQISALKDSFEKLTTSFEETPLSSQGNVRKKRVNLLKAIIGERCHDHLLDELLRLLQREEIISVIDSLIPLDVVKRFGEEGK